MCPENLRFSGTAPICNPRLSDLPTPELRHKRISNDGRQTSTQTLALWTTSTLQTSLAPSGIRK